MPDVLAKQIAALDSHAKNCKMLVSHIEAIKSRLYPAKVHEFEAKNSFDKEVRNGFSVAREKTRNKLLNAYVDAKSNLQRQRKGYNDHTKRLNVEIGEWNKVLHDIEDHYLRQRLSMPQEIRDLLSYYANLLSYYVNLHLFDEQDEDK